MPTHGRGAEPAAAPPGSAETREARRARAGPFRVFVSGAAAILAICGGALVVTSLLTEPGRPSRAGEQLADRPPTGAEADPAGATSSAPPALGAATVPGRPTERRPPAAPADLGAKPGAAAHLVAKTGAANAAVSAATLERWTPAAMALGSGAGSPRGAETVETPLVTKKMARALARTVSGCIPVDIRASRRANPKRRQVADRPAMLLDLVARDGRLEVTDANVTSYGDLALEHLACARDALRGKRLRVPPRMRRVTGERVELRWVLP